MTCTAGDGDTEWTWSSLVGLAAGRVGVAVGVDRVGGGVAVRLAVPLLVAVAVPTTTAGPMSAGAWLGLIAMTAASTMPAVISSTPPTARMSFRMTFTVFNTELSQIRPG